MEPACRAPHLWALTLAVGMTLSGCRPAVQRLGEFPSGVAVTTISEIRSGPGSFDGKLVRIDGRLTRVCQHVGCWFYITDERSEIYVDLQNGLRFVVPTRSAGRRAQVVGTVRLESGEPRVIARGVELR
jgi:hypothetical protein